MHPSERLLLKLLPGNNYCTRTIIARRLTACYSQMHPPIAQPENVGQKPGFFCQSLDISSLPAPHSETLFLAST